MMAAIKFCGNPFNHDAHDYGDGPPFVFCEGVDREVVSEVIVEKYEPHKQAEDGTEYSKVTILIEDSKGVTIVSSERVSLPHASAKVSEHIPLDKSSANFFPEVESVEFRFNTHKFGDESGIKIRRVVYDGK